VDEEQGIFPGDLQALLEHVRLEHVQPNDAGVGAPNRYKCRAAIGRAADSVSRYCGISTCQDLRASSRARQSSPAHRRPDRGGGGLEYNG